MGHPIPPSVATFCAAVRCLFSQARDHRALAATRKASSRLPAHKSIDRLTVGALPERLYATMRKFLFLLVCLSLSLFTVARASKPAHAFALETEAEAWVNHANTEEDVASDDDDSMEGADDDQGEDMNDDDGGDAAGDEDTGDDDGTEDDEGDDGGE